MVLGSTCYRLTHILPKGVGMDTLQEQGKQAQLFLYVSSPFFFTQPARLYGASLVIADAQKDPSRNPNKPHSKREVRIMSGGFQIPSSRLSIQWVCLGEVPPSHTNEGSPNTLSHPSIFTFLFFTGKPGSHATISSLFLPIRPLRWPLCKPHGLLSRLLPNLAFAISPCP